MNKTIKKKQSNIEDVYSLSPMQQGMLFHTLAPKELGTYICQVCCSFRGKLDRYAFDLAWQSVIQRHSILRTGFIWSHVNKPVQVVLKWVDLYIQHYDWTRLCVADQQTQLALFCQESRLKGFDLRTPPLLSISLLQADKDRFYFVLNYHHLLLDGWSVQILIGEVLQLYSAYCQGQPAGLGSTYKYRDYIAWLQCKDISEAKSFWADQLQGFCCPISLRLVRSVGENYQCQQEQHVREQVSLSQEATLALHEIAQEHGLTMNTLIQGAWAILLSRYSGQEDIVFGHTVSGRSPEVGDIESMVGLFINTLPIRVQVVDDRVFLAWLESLQCQQVQMRQYEYTSLMDIQRWSEVRSGTELFDSLVVFENYPLEKSMGDGITGLQLEDIRAVEMVTFPVALLASLRPELTIDTLYDQRHFERSAIIRMLNHLRRLLENLPQYITRRLGEVLMLSEAESHQLLFEWNDTDTDYSKDACLHELFEAQSQGTPDSIAVVFDDNHLTYRELSLRTNKLARYLKTLGVSQGVCVGICVSRSPDMILGILGILKAGGAYIPIDPSYPEKRISIILEDACILVLLTQTCLLDKLVSEHYKVICLDRDWGGIERENGEPLLSRISAESFAYGIYTSGTTGKPKQVMVQHRPVVNLIEWVTHMFAIQPQDKILFITSLCFDLSIYDIFGILAVGAQIKIAGEEDVHDPQRLINIINQERITFWDSAPAMFEQLVSFASQRPTSEKENSLRLVFLSGDWIPVSLPDRARVLFPHSEIVSLGGATEAVVWSNYYRINNVDLNWPSIPYGRPIQNGEYFVLDSFLRPCPIGVLGELYIGGQCLSLGYNDSRLTAEKYIPHPFASSGGRRLYRTGDSARYLSDGNIELLGRVDHQVKIRGFRVELGEIEAVLRSHKEIAEAIVLAEGERCGSKRLVAYIVGVKQHIATPKELQYFVGERLPDYMIPSAFVPLESLPLTPNGKLDRASLPAPDGSRPALTERYVEPETSIERLLAQIWSDVLECDRIGIHDNFFDLGGDSLLILRVLVELQKRGLKVTLNQLIRHQTVSQLAQIVQVDKASVGEYRFESGPVHLLPSEHWLFERELPDLENYNTARLFKTMRNFSPYIVNQVLQLLAFQHDALRIRFQKTSKNWDQICDEPGGEVFFLQIDMTLLPKKHRDLIFPVLIKDLRKSLDLETGPLIRFIHLRFGPGERGRLLVVVSHLICDGVSLAILINDFQMAYQCLSKGSILQLPPSTTSLKLWAERLHMYAQTPEARSELEFWLGQSWSLVESLPMDFFNKESANTYESSDDIQMTLNRGETKACVEELSKVYSMSIGDLLLAVLAYCISRWGDMEVVLLDITVNGRESLFADIDPSRVVGYLTSTYPIVLDLRASNTSCFFLSLIRQQLDEVPNGGIGYGILRYLSKDKHVRNKLVSLPNPQIKFNYSGQYGWSSTQGGVSLFDSLKMPFRPVKEMVPGVLNGSDQRKYLLNFESVIHNGRLFLSVKYSRKMHKRETVLSLCNQYLDCLRSLTHRTCH